MIDWNACLSSGFGAFVGAVIAFLVNWLKDWKQNKNEKEKELERYFYNLHFAIRNIANYMENCKQSLQWQIDPSVPLNVKNKNVPLSKINFEFNEDKICFISNVQPLFYECIKQLQVDLKTFYKNGDEFNKNKNDETFNELVASFLQLCPKLLKTAQNVNAYLKKYYKHKEMIVGYIETNLKNLEFYFKEQVGNIKNQALRKMPDLAELKKIEDMENICLYVVEILFYEQFNTIKFKLRIIAWFEFKRFFFGITMFCIICCDLRFVF